MRWEHWKPVVIVALIGLTVCVVTYAGKQKETDLPAAVKTAIESLYPQAVIEEAEAEEEGLKVYEVELKQKGKEFEVTIGPNGTIVEVESKLTMEDLPAAVAEAIAKAAAGASVKQVEQEVTYAVVKLIKLDKPMTTYEAELIKDGEEREIEVAADGTVLELKVKDDDKDDKGDDDDEDEQQVSIDHVPAAVKATILEHAKGGKIQEIERENEDGKVIYEAEVIIGNKEVELKIDSNGKLISKEVEDDDEGDDDDDDDDDD
jgi:uncharacterized membrane protein YkoI